MQQVLRQGDAGGVPHGAVYNSFVQLALHCVRWGFSVPRTSGELAWEERFVGPLVSNVFEAAFARGSLRWTGCAVLRRWACSASSYEGTVAFLAGT